MYQGFYNLASGMLTQSRNLNVISNNMVNVQTSGYKRDKMVTSTFQEEMLYRTGTKQKGNPVPLAVTSKIKTASETHVDYEQGKMCIRDRQNHVYLLGVSQNGIQLLTELEGDYIGQETEEAAVSYTHLWQACVHIRTSWT